MKTLKEQIEVMQAALDGKEIEYRNKNGGAWGAMPNPNFDGWDIGDYRIKPEPMEFWISIFDSGSAVISPTYGEAPAGTKTIKAREVIE